MLKTISPVLARLSDAAYRRHGGAVERAGSARRINRAADDAAGLGVATNLRTTERSQRAAMRNISNAQSIVATAESGLVEITHNLQRMRELAMAAASETLDDDERAFLAEEFAARIDEIDDIAARTEFDDTELLAGAGIDVAFIINSSLSMNLEISALLAAVSDFETRFADAGLDVSLSLSEVNAGKDSLDGSARLSAMGDGTFQAELATLSTQFGLQDPYAAVLEATGLETITGDIDPDDVGFRTGAKERHIIMMGDDVREVDLVPGSETGASVGAELAAAGFIVHAVIDTAVSSTYSPLVSATGGNTYDAGNLGQFIDSALTDIADIITARVGSSDPMSVQVGIDAEDYSTIDLGLPINATASGLGMTTREIATVDGARDALDAIDRALDDVNSARATLGASTNRLESAYNRLVDDMAPIARAQSVIMDADMADVTSEMVASRILMDSSVGAMAQARGISSDMILALLG